MVSETCGLLEKLVAFPSMSANSNIPIISFIGDYLEAAGVSNRTLITNAAGSKLGLVARIGPDLPGGVVLSAHSDVVPVAGQPWSRDPFRLTSHGGRLYGRGAADMKGFLASMLSVAALAARRELSAPLTLVISYDEEVGCLGIQEMLPRLEPILQRPRLCIVGEPTLMQIATGHKGKLSVRAQFRGAGGHSAMAPRFLNALHLASDFISTLRNEQRWLAREGAQDSAYDIPYSTVHAGRLEGGVALNVVPDRAVIDFEIRHLAADDPETILQRIGAAAAELEAIARAEHASAAIHLNVVTSYPGLGTPPHSPAVRFASALLPDARQIRVAYGTEAGFFDKLGIPTVVCGPGSMDQGHQPDEFIARDQLALCDRFLRAVVDTLAA